MLKEDRVVLFTGHYGSGKTEIAVNYSLLSAQQGIKTTLVDLDIVNPFFRSTEVKELLQEKGIKVISPTFASTTVDVPSLPGEIYSVFADRTSRVIFDVGGDDIGARALGRYFHHFSQEAYRMFYVINLRRPLSENKEDIIEMMRAVETKSRLQITDLINNTNLSYETKFCDIIYGQAVVKEVSRELKIPVAYITGTKDVLNAAPIDMGTVFFPINLYMNPPWRK